MAKWTNLFSLKAKLAWINCVGVPLCFWNAAFFNKLGRLVGEMKKVEEGTLMKRRVDRGRILALVPHNKVCPNNIKVKVDRGLFVVNLSEESLLVDYS
ncbi:hypothetical protein Q3G72_030164 [Acer saccharum]|nr:hypothetical protein Q3G72_030164 [Acer saccharum]